MKLSEYKNEEALDLLADVIEPVTTMLSDPAVVSIFQSDAPKVKLVTYLLKNHKAEVLEVLARLDGVPVSEYQCNVLSLPIKLLEIMKDKELMSFFSASAELEVISSGDATENTKDRKG